MTTEANTWRKKCRTIAAISIGNAFEWFDFVIFGYFAITIAKQFFFVDSRTSAILLTTAMFGAAFVMRPLGAIVLGVYADRYGRKPALIFTISLMMVGTALIAFAPTRDSVGPIAPCIIVLGRILQGFSAGGEFGSATAWLVEQDPRFRGFFASWQFASQAMAVVFATSVGAILSMALGAEQLDEWGWRIPFVLGILIGPVSIYIRSRIPESLEFQTVQISASPTREIVASFKSKLVTAFGLVTVATVTIYTLVFMPSFAVQYLGYSLADGFVIGLMTGVIQTIVIPIAGALSDKWGRLPIASVATFAILVTAIPLLMHVTSTPTFRSLLIFQMWLGSSVAIYLGVLPAMMSELFPTRIRTTGLSVSYSFSVALFGGFAPFINALLIELSGSSLAPSFYIVAASLISLAALAAARQFGIK